MLYSDEVGERHLRMAKRFANVTSTRQDASISESLQHGLYKKVLRKKKTIPAAKIWAVSIVMWFWRHAWFPPMQSAST